MQGRDSAPRDLKVGELTPRSRNFNVTAKILDIGETREIPSKTGGPTNRVAEALVGDDSGNVLLSLWNDQIADVNEGDTITLENAYVSLVRGHLRLNVGKYGKLVQADGDVEANADNKNISDAEHPDERRERGGGFGGGGGRGGGGGGYGGRGGGGYGGGGGRGGGGGGGRDRDRDRGGGGFRPRF